MAEEARLIVTQEDEPEIILDLTEERISIGRSVNNELVIKDANASRRHAEIRRVSVGRFRLFDIGSANGTWINGRRVTSPKQLKDGDEISIGAVKLRFVAPAGLEQSQELSQSSASGASRTRLSMRNETILVLVSDIRNYTGMSEALPAQELSSLVSDWFRDASKIIEDNGGTIDKFIGDAVMAYWILANPQSRTEANSALRASKEMIKLSEHYSEKVEEKFPGHTFRVGIGLNVGDVYLDGTPRQRIRLRRGSVGRPLHH